MKTLFRLTSLIAVLFLSVFIYSCGGGSSSSDIEIGGPNDRLLFCRGPGGAIYDDFCVDKNDPKPCPADWTPTARADLPEVCCRAPNGNQFLVATNQCASPWVQLPNKPGVFCADNALCGADLFPDNFPFDENDDGPTDFGDDFPFNNSSDRRVRETY